MLIFLNLSGITLHKYSYQLTKTGVSAIAIFYEIPVLLTYNV